MDEYLNVQSVIMTAARSVQRKYHSYTEYGDLLSIGFIWVFEHDKKMDEYQEMEEVRLAAWRLGQDLWRKMDRYARKERAFAVGYQPKDEAFYTEVMIRDLLPQVILGDPVQDKRAREEVRAGPDPAEGGDFLASYLDVQRAWYDAPLTKDDRVLLTELYAVGTSQEAVGAALGVDQSTVSRQHNRAVRKLQKYLGGPPSRDCPYTCECHEAKLRIRPGTRSNDSGRNQLLS